MQKDLSDYRKNYQRNQLLEEGLPENPIELFRDWFLEVDQGDSVDEANAFTLSTMGLDGFPRGRVVLMKRFTYEGIEFFTNYESEKGRAIAQNNRVCASFYWPAMERQVIWKGEAEKLLENLSDGYYDSRPRGSKLGAWASRQSTVVTSRDELDQALEEFEKRFPEGTEVPRPPYWGGFLIRPTEIEFWQGRPNRMHDRIRYRMDSEYNWNRERLAP